MRYFLLILMAFSFSATAQANQPLAPALDQLAVGNVEMVTCPAISEDFSQLLTRLDALKATIKKGANCKDIDTTITSKFDGITKTRDRFLELIKKSQTETLTESEVKEIGSYADQVTTKVASIIDLMTNANSCFESDADKKALTSLSGFVSEAATLLSQVAGPWGAPVAIGGQIISGFISGLDKILKSRAGYDFSDRAQWIAYIQNLCTYTAIRQNAEALLHPQDRISTLQSIASKLDQNMTAIAGVCPECREVQAMPAAEVSKDAKIQSIDSHYSLHMGSLAARVRNAQLWVKTEIARVSTESNAYWNNVTGKNALSASQRDLEDFLLGKEAPKFLSYQYSESANAFLDLQNFLFSTGRAALHDAYQVKLVDQEPALNRGSIFWGWGNPPSTNAEVPVYQALTNTDWRAKYQSLGKNPDDLAYRLISARKAALAKFDAASWAYGVSYVFCDFFQQSELYSSSLQASCTGSKAKTLSQNVAELAAMTPEWQRASSGIRAADWTSALSAWADQVQMSVNQGPFQYR